MKTRKSIRVVTVLFSATLFAGYVVHSQLQHSRSIEQSSKPASLTDAPGQTQAVNVNLTNNSQRAIAPGSKSLAPLLQVRQNPTVSKGASAGPLAPGSKSAAVFDFRQAQTPETASLPRRSANNVLSTNGNLSAQP